MRLIAILGLALSAIACNGQAFFQTATLQTATFGGSVGSVTEILDTFTDTALLQLTNHTTDASVAAYTWVTDDGSFLIDSTGTHLTNNVNGVTSDYPWYWVNHTMSSADYTATIDIIVLNTGGSFDLAIRDNLLNRAGGKNAYFLHIDTNTGLAGLYKLINNVKTQLGTNLTMPGQPTNILISASGTTISAKVNNTAIPGTPIVDASVAGPGGVGIGGGYFNTTHSFYLNFDNLTVTRP
jgi:hypothetical protein